MEREDILAPYSIKQNIVSFLFIIFQKKGVWLVFI